MAVKCLSEPAMMLDEAAAEAFAHEVALMRKLRSRNIVYFYGAGMRDNVPFLVTEFMPRGGLDNILHGAAYAQLTWGQKLSFARDTAHGLDFLHSLQLLHRDLKSANLLVSGAEEKKKKKKKETKKGGETVKVKK